MGKDTPTKKRARPQQQPRLPGSKRARNSNAEEAEGQNAGGAADGGAADPAQQQPAADLPVDPNRPLEVRAFAKQHLVMMRGLMRVLANGDPAVAAKLLQNDTAVLLSLPPRFYQACQQALFGLHPLHGAVLQAQLPTILCWATPGSWEGSSQVWLMRKRAS